MSQGCCDRRTTIAQLAGLRAELETLLEAVRRGEVEPAVALEHFAALPYRDLGFARVDLTREIRQDAPEVVQADCVVVCAGMDAALASVVGGLVGCPIIGVPTSVGYGSAQGGQTALNAMLCSCAAGLAVVGIDDGVGAGTIAARIARQST